jgi:hypothetical protein
MAGRTGATMAPTGMPALASASMASRRRCGVEARGSMMLASAGSRVVTERLTDTASYFASSWRTSMSRVTRWFLVMMQVGLRNSARTWRQRRVISSFRSIGW